MDEMIGRAPNSPITGIPGWITAKEELILMKYAANVPADHDGICSCIVEIGSEYGRSAGAFLKAADPEVFMHCIDLFPDDLLRVHSHNLQQAGVFRQGVIYHKGNSHEHPHFHWASGAQPAIDLLFIDGDHRYEGVSKDLAFWPLNVLIGGYLLMHDVANSTNPLAHAQHHEVARAIREWWAAGACESWQWIEDVDSLTVFKRTGRHD